MMSKVVTMALLGGVLYGAPCQAQPTESDTPRVSWGGEATVASAYLWRGEMDIDRFTLQPELWLGLGDLTMSSWSAFADGGLHEHDLSLTLQRDVAGVSVSGGWINYFLPHADERRHDNELFAGIEYSAALTPSFTFWHGVGATRSVYMEAAVTSRLPWRHVTIEPALAAGYGGAGDSTAQLTHLEGTVAVAWHGRGYAVRPFVSRIVALRSDRADHTAVGLLAVVGR